MTQDLEIRHCRVLLAVNEHRSVSAAARELGLAQSTISETLLSLERVIGAPVMLRRPGKEAILTATAETLLPHARALVAASESAVASVSANRRGLIRLGAVESVSSYILPRALAEFRANWPSVEVQINIGLCDELRRRVQRAEIDAALTLDSGHRTEAVADSCCRSLSPAELCFVVSSLPAAKKQFHKSDIAGKTFLLPDPDGAFPTLLRAWFGDLLPSPRLISAGSIGGVISGLEGSDVVGFLPKYAVAEQLMSATIFALKVVEPLPSVFVGLTTQRPLIEASPIQGIISQIEKSVAELHSKRAI